MSLPCRAAAFPIRLSRAGKILVEDVRFKE
jgi:hypothetical protein